MERPRPLLLDGQLGGVSMLGLRYGTVQLVPYRLEWARAFADERARLSEALSKLPCQIEHVGSTAVPGLHAKPILDIAVGLPPGSAPKEAVSAIRALSYEYRGDAGAEGGHILVRGPEPFLRTHHVHVVDLGGSQWESYIVLRDFLRQDQRARGAYSAQKAALAQRYPNDRRAYSAAKDDIVQRLLSEARRTTSHCSGATTAGFN